MKETISKTDAYEIAMDAFKAVLQRVPNLEDYASEEWLQAIFSAELLRDLLYYSPKLESEISPFLPPGTHYRPGGSVTTGSGDKMLLFDSQ